MPALLCLSPLLADQSFPRHDHELVDVAAALGAVAELVEGGEVKLLRTEFFDQLLEEFRWEGPFSLKREIHQHLHHWFLNGNGLSEFVEVLAGEAPPHPLPVGCASHTELADLWAAEIGAVLRLHDERMGGHDYCIGIACEQAFAGRPMNSYEPPPAPRRFPLVGPTECDCSCDNPALVDAYTYDVLENIFNVSISFAEAHANIGTLGGVVSRPSNGSHFIVKFNGARSWPLDRNDDPLPDRPHLRGLAMTTKRPLAVVKHALKTGRLPSQKFRLT